MKNYETGSQKKISAPAQNITLVAAATVTHFTESFSITLTKIKNTAILHARTVHLCSLSLQDKLTGYGKAFEC